MIVGVIQARMGSRRFPGKVLEPLGGKPMIERQIERAAPAKLDELVVATSSDPTDEPLCAELERIGIRYFCGALEDVLDRVYRAALASAARHVVRLTADCPLTDYRIVDSVLDAHLGEGNDYTSNTLRRSYPDGLDVEVVTMDALQTAWRECTDPEQREHVTPYIHAHNRRFKLGNVANSEDQSHYRVTVDYPEDLAVVRDVFDTLYPQRAEFSCADIVALLRQRPELVELNAERNAYLAEAVEHSGAGSGKPK